MVNNVLIIALVMLLPAQAFGAHDQDEKSLEISNDPVSVAQNPRPNRSRQDLDRMAPLDIRLLQREGGMLEALPDRWRIVESIGVNERWWDPYNQNTLKGDRPILGSKDLFFALGLVSDTVVEPRTFPIPVGVQTTGDAGQYDLHGDGQSNIFSQTIIASLSLIKGSTTFKPQDWEFRLTPAFNFNRVDINERRVLYVQPSKFGKRSRNFGALQEAFYDYHIRNVGSRYDFDSVRIGIQPFSSDFRGFLLQDALMGVRLFGNRDNNRYQYNLAYFRRLDKDVNSGLNDLSTPLRRDHILTANLYRQDFPSPGLTSQISITANLNEENRRQAIDANGFPTRPALIGDLRPRRYHVTYLGYSLDGRYGRLNVAGSAYAAFGQDKNNPMTSRSSKIRSHFLALELSVDNGWQRYRLSGVYASGDDNVFDDKASGFDAIFENPLIAGADTSYWMRQTIPFVGGGRGIGLNGRNGLLPSLRSSKEQGQSFFSNPGLMLLGVGADFDLTPSLRWSVNYNHLWFDEVDGISQLRMQSGITRKIGVDASTSLIYRPGFIQNFVIRFSYAELTPGAGFSRLFDSTRDDDRFYSGLLNVVISY